MNDENQGLVAAEPPVSRTRQLARVICWANRFGDVRKYRAKAHPGVLRAGWTDGYEQAMSDVLRHLQPLAPDWIETWREEDWGSNREADHGVEGF